MAVVPVAVLGFRDRNVLPAGPRLSHSPLSAVLGVKHRVTSAGELLVPGISSHSRDIHHSHQQTFPKHSLQFACLIKWAELPHSTSGVNL